MGANKPLAAWEYEELPMPEDGWKRLRKPSRRGVLEERHPRANPNFRDSCQLTALTSHRTTGIVSVNTDATVSAKLGFRHAASPYSLPT